MSKIDLDKKYDFRHVNVDTVTVFDKPVPFQLYNSLAGNFKQLHVEYCHTDKGVLAYHVYTVYFMDNLRDDCPLYTMEHLTKFIEGLGKKVPPDALIRLDYTDNSHYDEKGIRTWLKILVPIDVPPELAKKLADEEAARKVRWEKDAQRELDRKVYALRQAGYTIVEPKKES